MPIGVKREKRKISIDYTKVINKYSLDDLSNQAFISQNQNVVLSTDDIKNFSSEEFLHDLKLNDIDNNFFLLNEAEIKNKLYEILEKRPNFYDYKYSFPVIVSKDYAKQTLPSWLGTSDYHMVGYNVAFFEKNYIIVLL